jgi:hypothetical protein
VDFQSPEHRRGLPVDRRADIFSLGRVMQHMVECMVPEVVRSDLPALIARACHRDPDQRFSDMKDFNVALRLIAKNRALDPTRAACEKFTLEIFGHKVAKTDPRAQRPQPAVPLMRSSEGQKTSYEPVTPPAHAHFPPEERGNLSGEGEATAVGEVMDGKPTVMGAMEDSGASTMRDLSAGQATIMGGMEDQRATVMGDMVDAKITNVGEGVDIEATTEGEVYRELPTVVGAAFDPKATTLGETAESATFDPKATTLGETAESAAFDPKATTLGETAERAAFDPKATTLGETAERAAFDPKATTLGELADSMMTTVPGGSLRGTATKAGAPPERSKFVDAHLAVTSIGGSAAPPATPATPAAAVHLESEEVTAFAVPAIEDTEKQPAKGGFREELIPTKPYATHDGEEDGA